MPDILRKGDTPTGPDGLVQNQAAAAGGSSNSFETINCPSGTDPVADSATDTLNLTAGTGISITGDSATDTVTIANTGYVAGGTDVAIADGGTGASTAQAAIDALTQVSGATNEHVLTKDTASGNAIFKAAAGGIGGSTGATDNAILAADGVGGSTLQARNAAIDDAGQASFGTTTPAAQIHAVQATLGNAVMQLTSTATNDDPTETTYQGRVATTDATVTAIFTYAVPASTTVNMEVVVVARRTGGTAGTAEDGASYHIEGTFKNVAGTATAIGSVSTISTKEDQAAWNCTIAASGGNAVVRVTGALDNNVTWHALVKVRQVSS